MVLYLANWGSKQPAFRFPKAAHDAQARQPYVFGVDEIEQTVEFFGIDQDLIGAAATASPALKATKEPIERRVPLLPELERNSLLVRAARGERLGHQRVARLGFAAQILEHSTPPTARHLIDLAQLSSASCPAVALTGCLCA